MKRNMSDRNILDDFCQKFCDVLERHCKYIVVSGFVAISSGRTRGTEDIDVIIERLDKKEFISLHRALIKAGFVCMQTDDPEEMFEKYLSKKTSIRYTFGDHPLPEMELMFSKDLLDDTQIKTRVKLELTGLDIWFSNINVNIAFKELYLGSEKDLEDARHLRIVYRNLVDEQEINRIKDMIRKYRMGKKNDYKNNYLQSK
ncbi:MAG: hypothetical protein V1870_04025 [Candidatus Aenigmatarchaeota archaeon]